MKTKDIPKDIWNKTIIDYLPEKDFITLTTVSKWFRSFYSTPTVWKTWLERDYNIKPTSDDEIQKKYYAAKIFNLGKAAVRLSLSINYFDRTIKAVGAFTFENEPWAKYYLGSIYLNGWAGKADIDKGISLLKEAAKSNYYPAIKELLTFLLNDISISTKQKEGLHSFVRAKLIAFEKRKVLEAILDLGMCYHTGFIVKKDINKAITLFKDAIQRRVSKAYCRLGCAYKDLGQRQLALNTFQIALNNGDAEAAQHIGAMYYEQNDYAQAIKWFKDAFAKGQTEAALNIASLYFTGNYMNSPQTPDLVEAEKWALKAWDAGSHEAARTLGLMKAGKGGDQKEMLRWLNAAAEKGNAKAALNLGDYYSKQRNFEKAIFYYNDAFELGDKASLKKIVDLIFSHQNEMSDIKLIESIYWLVLVANSNDMIKNKINRLSNEPSPTVFNLVLCLSNIILNPGSDYSLKKKSFDLLNTSSHYVRVCWETIKKLTPFLSDNQNPAKILTFLDSRSERQSCKNNRPKI